MKINYSRSENLHILFILVIAVLLRLLFVFFACSNDAFLTPDSYEYINLADSLVLSGSYNSIFRAPLYPCFLAICKLISGSYFVIFALAIQIALDILSVFIVGLLSLRLFKIKFIAALSTFLYAISPLLIQSSSMILTETIFNFLLLFTFLLISGERISGKKAFISGILMGFLTLTRTVFLPLILLFLIFLFFQSKSFKNCIVCFIGCYLLLFGWGLRNYLETSYKGISSVSAINTYRYNACALEAKLENKSFSEMQEIFDEKLNSFQNQKDQAEYASETGWQIILNHPFKYAIIHFKTSLNTLLPSTGDFAKTFGVKIGDSGTLAVINSEGIIAGTKHYFSGNLSLFLFLLPLTILLGVEYIFAVIGAILSLKTENKLCVIFLIISALYFIFVGGPASTPRFRIPAEPIIFIFASYGVYAVIGKFKKTKETL